MIHRHYILAVALLLLICSIAHASGDVWYVDVDGHWAAAAVRALWAEGVADGFGPSSGPVYFRPDSAITRGEYAMLAAKVFDLDPWPTQNSTYADLGPDLLLYDDRPAFEYVEAAVRAGILAGICSEYFAPHDLLNRGTVVASLVGALGLESFALALTPEQISLYLSRFSDSGSIAPAIRPQIAAAVRLRILRGYPDGTLRLTGIINRAETASLVHRSCLFRISSPCCPIVHEANHYPAMPIRSLRNRNAHSWVLEIVDARGLQILGLAGQAEPPGEFAWDGRDGLGRLMPPGLYFAGGVLRDLEGNTYQAVPAPVYIEGWSLIGFLSPLGGPAGTAVTITCTTTGRPHSVWLVNPDQVALEPAGSGGSHTDFWQGQWVAAGDGPVTLTVEASFATGSRRLSLLFNVAEGTWLNGYLVPDILPAGATMEIYAQTVEGAAAVTAYGPHGPLALSRQQPQAWAGHYRIPLDAVPGHYTLLLEATGAMQSLSLELTYEVEGSLRDQVEMILTE